MITLIISLLIGGSAALFVAAAVQEHRLLSEAQAILDDLARTPASFRFWWSPVKIAPRGAWLPAVADHWQALYARVEALEARGGQIVSHVRPAVDRLSGIEARNLFVLSVRDLFTPRMQALSSAMLGMAKATEPARAALLNLSRALNDDN